MNETIPDYRDVLLRHFELKRAKRPSYSLRAYAKDLQLTPSNLSDVLKGRCGISSAVASRIAEALKLGSEESAFFADLVESKHARSRADREAALKRVQQFKADPFNRQSGAESVPLFEKWYYVAALEFLTMRKGEVEAEDIAEGLGIEIEQAHEALSRLLTSGQIRREAGYFARNENYLFAETAVPSAVIRGFHKQILERAAIALDTQAMDQRKPLSTVLTFDTRRLQEAMAFLDEMDKEFFNRFEAKVETDSVYAFALQLFRIDKPEGRQQ